jgi:hypothetical protein
VIVFTIVAITSLDLAFVKPVSLAITSTNSVLFILRLLFLLRFRFRTVCVLYTVFIYEFARF